MADQDRMIEIPDDLAGEFIRDFRTVPDRAEDFTNAQVAWLDKKLNERGLL